MRDTVPSVRYRTQLSHAATVVENKSIPVDGHQGDLSQFPNDSHVTASCDSASACYATVRTSFSRSRWSASAAAINVSAAPDQVARAADSRTALYLALALA